MKKHFPTYYPRIGERKLTTVTIEAWPFRSGYMHTVTGYDLRGTAVVCKHVHGLFTGLRALRIAKNMKRDYRY